MTVDDFRQIALSLPEAEEHEHMDHPDFRVGGKIFATLWPQDKKGVVMLPPDRQAEFIAAKPKAFAPVKGGWGRQGATEVVLRAATKSIARDALIAAWRKRASKKLTARHEML